MDKLVARATTATARHLCLGRDSHVTVVIVAGLVDRILGDDKKVAIRIAWATRPTALLMRWQCLILTVPQLADDLVLAESLLRLLLMLSALKADVTTTRCPSLGVDEEV